MDLTCAQYKAHSGQDKAEDVEGVARCPQCRVGGVKDNDNDGTCNVIRCYDCRIYYCYLCQKKCDSAEYKDGDTFHGRANGHFLNDKKSPCYPCLFMPRAQWLKEGGLRRRGAAVKAGV